MMESGAKMSKNFRWVVTAKHDNEKSYISKTLEVIFGDGDMSLQKKPSKKGGPLELQKRFVKFFLNDFS